MEDIYKLFAGSEPDAQQEAMAMAAALRRKKQGADGTLGLSQLASLGQNPLLAGLAQSSMGAAGQMGADVRQGQNMLGQAGQFRLQQAMAAQRQRQDDEAWHERNAITSKQALQRAHVMAGLNAKARDEADGRTREKEERAAKSKAEQQVVEIEDRARGAERSLTEMEKLIADKGVFEVGGAHNAQLQGAITAYVTDIAKLRDPGGVVRKDDVDLEMRGMFPTGIMGALSSDATAREVIGTLRRRLAERRAEAFKVRGLRPPASPGSANGLQLDAAGGGLTPEEAAEYEALRKELGK